jgi:ParB-like chromosome segregation protein Spo0J
MEKKITSATPNTDYEKRPIEEMSTPTTPNTVGNDNTTEKKSAMNVKDIPLDLLESSCPRKTTNFHLNPIRKSMSEIGMLEPLLVYEKVENETKKYLIIDGNKRFRILVESGGHESVPCILVSSPDTYTTSRQVISVSPVERAKMIKKVLETVAEEKVSAAIGVSSLKPMLDENFSAGLSQMAILAYENRLLTKTALEELKHVSVKRQDEILKELMQRGEKQKDLKQSKPCNIDIIKGLVLLTTDNERVTQKKRKTPWKKRDEKSESITKELREISARGELMSSKFHAYVSDLVKLLIYVRGFLNEVDITEYVQKNYPDEYRRIRIIMDREQ